MLTRARPYRAAVHSTIPDLGKEIDDVPHALSIDPSDDLFNGDSTIADIANRELWIAIGPPQKSTFDSYSV